MDAQELGGHAGAIAQDPQQQVLRAEVAVAQPLSLLPGQIQDLMGLLGESLEHPGYLPGRPC